MSNVARHIEVVYLGEVILSVENFYKNFFIIPKRLLYKNAKYIIKVYPKHITTEDISFNKKFVINTSERIEVYDSNFKYNNKIVRKGLGFDKSVLTGNSVEINNNYFVSISEQFGILKLYKLEHDEFKFISTLKSGHDMVLYTDNYKMIKIDINTIAIFGVTSVSKVYKEDIIGKDEFGDDVIIHKKGSPYNERMVS